MGSIVNIYSGPHDARVLEGKVEIIEVLKYKGNGLYSIRCIFLDDAKKLEQTREYNIVEEMERGERRSIS